MNYYFRNELKHRRAGYMTITRGKERKKLDNCFQQLISYTNRLNANHVEAKNKLIKIASNLPTDAKTKKLLVDNINSAYKNILYIYNKKREEKNNEEKNMS